MSKKSDEFSVNDAMRLAQSPAGQRLFAALQAQNGDALRSAMDQAAKGDYDQVKKTMAELLKDPKMQALLQQLGG